MDPMIVAAVALPEPVMRGFSAIIFLALEALINASGSRMIPKQKSPTMARISASLASLQGIVASSGIAPAVGLAAMVLQAPQYCLPEISTRQFEQNGSAQPSQRLTASTPG